MKESLISKFQTKDARIAILGLSYVGLPLATVFAEAGFIVTDIDPDQNKVDLIKRGESYIPDVPTERQVHIMPVHLGLNVTSDQHKISVVRA